MLLKAFKSKDLRGKILFTLIIIAIFEIGASIPVPGIDRTVLADMFSGENSGAFELFNMFTGGAFSNFTIFALGVTPYITASIIIQLFSISVPRIEQMSQEGETGRKKMATITRYLAVLMGFLQAAGITFGLFRNAITGNSALTNVSILFLLTAGMTILMWMGEQINEYGIGNGISIIIFASIANRLPIDVKNIALAVREGSISFVTLALIIAFAIFVIIVVIEMNEGVRKIPIQYANRLSGRRLMGNKNTHLPIKANTAGVIPIIFSLSILQFIMMFATFFPNSGYGKVVGKWLSMNQTPGVYVYAILNFLMIVGFTYFYTSIIFKPDEVSKNLASSGATIPGIRPGKQTRNYLGFTSNRLCFSSGIFLGLISSLPVLTGAFSPLNLSFGGTSILILVGVIIDTKKQLESRLVLEHNYSLF